MDLHVVTFGVPFPPHYGGAIDVWHRLRALVAEGVRVSLHTFVYGDHRPHPEVEALAAETHYYRREGWPLWVRRGFPLSVTSRKSLRLRDRLQADSRPILFEGSQTTGWAEALSARRLLLRAHNIEHQYYTELAQASAGWRRWIYAREAKSLGAYEPAMFRQMTAIFPISPIDAYWFADQGYPGELILPFHGLADVEMQPGHGRYNLYQGDLSLPVNQRALMDLITLAPPSPERPLVVAGRSGHSVFEGKLQAMANIRRYADVTHQEMIQLIRDAHVVFLHSLHASGMKLKVFPALYYGRFVAMSVRDRTGTPLDAVCHLYSPETLPDLLARLWARPVGLADIRQRRTALASLPDDPSKARQIIRYL